MFQVRAARDCCCLQRRVRRDSGAARFHACAGRSHPARGRGAAASPAALPRATRAPAQRRGEAGREGRERGREREREGGGLLLSPAPLRGGGLRGGVCVGGDLFNLNVCIFARGVRGWHCSPPGGRRGPPLCVCVCGRGSGSGREAPSTPPPHPLRSPLRRPLLPGWRREEWPRVLPPPRPSGEAAGQRPPFLRAARPGGLRRRRRSRQPCAAAGAEATEAPRPLAAGRRLTSPGSGRAAPCSAVRRRPGREGAAAAVSKAGGGGEIKSRSPPVSNQRDTSLFEHDLRAPSAPGLFGHIKRGRNPSPSSAARAAERPPGLPAASGSARPPAGGEGRGRTARCIARCAGREDRQRAGDWGWRLK